MSNRRPIDWHHHIASQRRSGLSIQEYCKREGFSIWSFYTRRKLLNSKTPPIKKDSFDSKSAFVNLGTFQPRSGMTIVFTNGIRVELPAPQNSEQLDHIFEVLQHSAVGGIQC